MNASLRRVAAVAAVSLPAVLPLASSASGAAAHHRQQRQLAVTTLTGSVKVVLTATRSPGTAPAPMATVAATVYRHTPRGWKLIATRRIGKPGQWFWFSVGESFEHSIGRRVPAGRVPALPEDVMWHRGGQPGPDQPCGVAADLHDAGVRAL